MQKSKNELITEFENLEKKIETISEKYDSKLMEIDKRIVNEDETAFNNIDETEFQEFENIKTEEAIELFVEIYEGAHQKTDLASVLSSFKQEYIEDLAESNTANEKEYIETMYKMNLETVEIENKMYNVAKAFLN